jgi:hypothetical protein
LTDRFIESIFEVLIGEFMMASNTKKMKRIRENKKKPNKANLKADLKRIQMNAERLRELAEEAEK